MTIVESRVRFLGTDSSAASFFALYVESFDNIYEGNAYYAFTLVTISRKQKHTILTNLWENARKAKGY